jgi:hypothetical protein
VRKRESRVRSLLNRRPVTYSKRRYSLLSFAPGQLDFSGAQSARWAGGSVVHMVFELALFRFCSPTRVQSPATPRHLKHVFFAPNTQTASGMMTAHLYIWRTSIYKARIHLSEVSREVLGADTAKA